MSRRSGKAQNTVYFAEYAGLKMLAFILSYLPEHSVYAIVRLLGYFAFHVLKIRRDVTLDNLETAFGDTLSGEKLKKIARDAYVNTAMTFAEVLLIPRLKDRIPDIVDMSDADVIRRSLDRGRGLILVSAHFGSWEMNGASIALAGFPVTVVGKRQSNPLVDAYITGYRHDFGMKMIVRGAPLKHLIRALRDREAIGLISDQNAGMRGVFVDFFGKMASTPAGAAQLALKYGAPIVVTMTKRIVPGRYRSIFREVEINPDDTVVTLTQRYTRVLEEIIRENPEQYFWMHKRWKTRPPGEKNGSAGRCPPGMKKGD